MATLFCCVIVATFYLFCWRLLVVGSFFIHFFVYNLISNWKPFDIILWFWIEFLMFIVVLFIFILLILLVGFNEVFLLIIITYLIILCLLYRCTALHSILNILSHLHESLYLSVNHFIIFLLIFSSFYFVTWIEFLYFFYLTKLICLFIWLLRRRFFLLI